jgi:hypothetical protein
MCLGFAFGMRQGVREWALAQYNGSILSFGSFHAMHEPGCWCNAGVGSLDMATSGAPEAGTRAQNKHAQMLVSMFGWLT